MILLLLWFSCSYDSPVIMILLLLWFSCCCDSPVIMILLMLWFSCYYDSPVITILLLLRFSCYYDSPVLMILLLLRFSWRILMECVSRPAITLHLSMPHLTISLKPSYSPVIWEVEGMCLPDWVIGGLGLEYLTHTCTEDLDSHSITP
jgi:hypothetical protein